MSEVKENKKKWYVVRAISGKERKVKEYIESEIEHLRMQEYVSQILIPQEKVYQIRNGKKVSKERNFFPGYLLVEAQLVGEIPHIIKNVPNNFNLVGKHMKDNSIEIISCKKKKILCLMFHPERVSKSQKKVDKIFKDFFKI